MKHGDNQDLQLAFSLHRAGKLNEAAALYREIIKRHPNNFHALQYLGIIKASNGNLGEAALLMARSVAIQPPNPQFFENYAAVLCQMRNYQTAFEVCRNGLRADGKNADLLCISANSLFLLGQLQEALDQFDALLSIKSDHLPAIVERSTVLLALEQYEAAAASIESALDLNPHFAEAHLNKGALCGRLKR